MDEGLLSEGDSDVDSEWERIEESYASDSSDVDVGVSATDAGADHPPAHEFPVESLEELSEEASSDANWMDDLIGQTFGGRYLIEEELARGGMGVVFRARQTNLNRPIVVKVISKFFVDGPEDVERFAQEALGLSALQHPNIVTVHDYGTESGLSYIAMEYLEGDSLQDRLERRGTLTMEEFARIAPQILKAIAAAHAAGIIHRDIKPANVMLTTQNQKPDFVKVVDFGLVKLAGGGREITGKGLVGTFAYVSPEQILGEPFDARSDVYALGVLFYHLLSGRKPFDDPDGMAILYKHVHEPPPNLATLLPEGHEVPIALIRTIHQCLEKDPARRPKDAKELLDVLVRRGVLPAEDESDPIGLRAHERALARIEAASFAARPSRRRLAALVVAGAIAIIGTQAGVTLLLPRLSQTPEPEQQPERERQQPAPDTTSAEGRIELLLAEAERRAEAGEWPKSRILLQRVQDEVASYPALLDRSIELEQRLIVAELLQEADRHQQRGATELAIRRLEDVLNRVPDHPEARERLAALHGGLPDGTAGTVGAQETGRPEDTDHLEEGGHVAAKTSRRKALRSKGTSDEAAPPAKEPPATSGKTSVAAPRLPSQIRIQNRRMLEVTLRRVESEVLDRNSFSALEVQNSTHLLFRAANRDLDAAKQPTLSPRKVYYAIANALKKGTTREAVAKQLEADYLAGRFD